MRKQLEKINLSYRKHVQLTISSGMTSLGRHRHDDNSFNVVHYEATIPNLDKTFSGYRLIHITDLHLGHWLSVERLRGVIKLVNKENPDTVAITGDFVSYVIDEIADDLSDSLKSINSKDATISVLGNHDHWMDSKKVRKILKKGNVIDLENDVFSIKRKGAGLHFAGVDDPYTNHDELHKVIDKLPKKGPAILLSHEPDFADIANEEKRFSLQLSGHSHGGQVVFPMLGPVIKGRGFKKYPLGHYHLENMALYTNPGLGTHTLRLRYNCQPEITVFTLKPERAGSTPKLKRS